MVFALAATCVARMSPARRILTAMTVSLPTSDAILFGDGLPAELDTRTPFADYLQAHFDLLRGGDALMTPVFWKLTTLGQFHPERNAMTPTPPSPLVCAAGRWFNNRERAGGLNWLNPCRQPVVTQIEFGNRGTFGFCEAHGDVLERALAEKLIKPYQVRLVDETGQAVPCATGRDITHAELDGWETECPAPPEHVVLVAGAGQYGFCDNHFAELDALGVILGDADIKTIAAQN